MIVKKIDDISYGIIHKEIKIKIMFGKINSHDLLMTEMTNEDELSISGGRSVASKFIFKSKMAAKNINFKDGNYMHCTHVGSAIHYLQKNNIIFSEQLYAHDASLYISQSMSMIIGQMIYLSEKQMGICYRHSTDEKNIIYIKHPQESGIIKDLLELKYQIRKYDFKVKGNK